MSPNNLVFFDFSLGKHIASKTHLAFPPVFRNGGHLRSKAVRVEGPVTDVTQEIAVVLVSLATVLAPLALLALPTAAYDRGDPNVGPSVVVMLKSLNL